MRLSVLLLFVGCGFAPQAGGDRDARLDGPPDTQVIGPSCSDQVKDGDELDVDCGGSCPACTNVFATDADTLARFELNGDVTDSSGNQRDATLLGGTFVTTSWGKGLSVSADPQGFSWTPYANLMKHPYTVEMVVTPNDTNCWRKLFGSNDAVDTGWNYCGQFQTYAPVYMVGPTLVAHQRHYFAVVSTSATTIDIYVNGTMIGSAGASFTAPPADAIFFRDDSATSRNERLTGVIEAVRISKIARSSSEILNTATRLAQQP